MTTKITEKNISSIANTGVQWQSVHVSDGSTALTATAGKGYFIDTTSGAQTVNFPSVDDSTTGDTIIIKDYARNFGSNAVTVASNTIDGTVGTTLTLGTNGQVAVFAFADATKGWTSVGDLTTTQFGATYTSATGGTITTSGNFKIHTFTGDGCFVVSSLGNSLGGGDKVSYMVVAGGGGTPGRAGGTGIGGGGGAGGYREGLDAPVDSYTASPLKAPAGLTITATTFPVTVGGGGAAGAGPSGGPTKGTNGSNSVFSTITSAGGGRGGRNDPDKPGDAGGSGGGGINGGTGGAGNTPPVSPSQGNAGGAGNSPTVANGGGGGGAGGTGGDGAPGCRGGHGGAGTTSCITGSPVVRAGGGAGARAKAGTSNCATNVGGGGAGGYGPGPSPNLGTAGTANTGGGAGGDTDNDLPGKAGGKGIVVIRYKFQ